MIITYLVYFSVGLVANLAIILVLMVSPVKTASFGMILLARFSPFYHVIIPFQTVHIIHLSLADTLLLSGIQIQNHLNNKNILKTLKKTTLPLNADSRLNNSNWRFGWMACKANESLKMINFFNSILFISLMAVGNGF